MERSTLIPCVLTKNKDATKNFATEEMQFFLLSNVVVIEKFLLIGGYKKFDNAFAYSETEPGKICLAFYSGIYSYAGWNYLNFMTEELKNPFVNLPRAIYLSLPVVTFLYILANVSYLAVLTPTEMMASNAIAVVSFHFHVTQNLCLSGFWREIHFTILRSTDVSQIVTTVFKTQ